MSCPIHIIISGASSVGKSTLVDQCFSYLPQYSFTRVQEVARTVLNRLKLTGSDLVNYIKENNLEKFVQIQEKIIEEQVVCFDQEKDKNYLSDRSGFDALAYIHYYFQNQAKTKEIFQKEFFQSLIQLCQNGLIFIIQPKEELIAENDNMRIVPNYQEQIKYTECLKYWYEQAHLSYFLIEELDLIKRVKYIQQHINGDFHWLTSEFPIPLCLPFHLEKPKDSKQLSIRSIEIFNKHHIQISYKKCDSNEKCIIISFHSNLDDLFIEKLLSNSVYINGIEHHVLKDDSQNRSFYLSPHFTSSSK